MFPLLQVLFLVLQLSAGVRLAGGSVSDSFGECRRFFYLHVPPTGIRGNNLRKICQRYGDKPRYATLYDASQRLAVFSAYTFKKTDGRSLVDTPWMYEPQLVSPRQDGNMRALPPPGQEVPLQEESQALLADYADAVEFRRVPLNPHHHQADATDKAATYTLTNVVPLVTEFFEGPWTAHVHILRHRLNNFCLGPAYLVTGVTVSGRSIHRGAQMRLAVPRLVWSAYCCPRFDRHAPYEVRYMLPSYAAYGVNERNQEVLEVPLSTLESLLRNEENMEPSLTLFYQDCTSENTSEEKK